MAKKDMVGFDNGYFKVISFLEMRRDSQDNIRAFWNCICYCGRKTIKNTYQLTSGIPRSCGCYLQIRKGNTIRHEYHTKHGLANKHPLYKAWKNIKSRCYNKNVPGYRWYGLKGIVICDEWKNDASKFINWCLEHGWKEGLVIDRIDNTNNYTPDNCQFITRAENCKKVSIDNPGIFQGSNRRGSLLTEDVVMEIKKYLLSGYSKKEVRIMFELSRDMIYQIANNKTWKHVSVGVHNTKKEVAATRPAQ